MKNILFLCTGNSARSVMAEAYMNHAGANNYRAYSAGSKPTGKPNPYALKTLAAQAVPAITGDGGAIRSKSWDVFATSTAPKMDYVVTVCDNAAGEVCPLWPVQDGSMPPVKLHWSFPDPAAATGSDVKIFAEFAHIFEDIRRQVDAFILQERD